MNKWKKKFTLNNKHEKGCGILGQGTDNKVKSWSRNWPLTLQFRPSIKHLMVRHIFCAICRLIKQKNRHLLLALVHAHLGQYSVEQSLAICNFSSRSPGIRPYQLRILIFCPCWSAGGQEETASYKPRHRFMTGSIEVWVLFNSIILKCSGSGFGMGLE